MTPETWQRINDLFEEARRQTTAGRGSFLARACGGDDDLRGAVARLLEEDEQAQREGFLTVPCPLRREVHPVGPPAGLTGRRVGPYEVRERVGGGGMGDVYRAVRIDDYRQEVALKLIKPGLDGAEVRGRFRTERQVLADLQHPHIARLFDGGTTDDGLPYLVMEYIDGLPIDRFCEARQVDVRGRVRLLHAVCLAVQYAHDRGVMHRDLKPGNVLVTADGTPRLTDFGLARYLADEGQTQTGALVGTPSYMAPEQAAGDRRAVGPPADVYALGAILYELLTGRPPFRGTNLRDTLEQVCSQEPVPPSRLHPKLPRDLETICLKCLRKEPARRYPAARDLADDVERFLDGRPIHARPVGRAERLGRWCRRNPRVAGLLAVLALVVVAGFTAVTCLWLLARAEQREADRQRRRAEDNEQVAWQAVDDITRVAEGVLATEPRMTEAQLHLLEKALDYRQRFIREHRTDATVRFKTAQAYHFVGRLRTRMGRPAQAVEAFHDQAALLDELVADYPGEPKYRFDLFHCYRESASPLGHLGREDEAEEATRRAFALIQDLMRDDPGQPFYRDSLAHQGIGVGTCLARRGDHAGAKRAYREAVAVAEALVRDYPDRREPPAFAANLSQGLLLLASDAQQQGQADEAEAYYRRALPVARKTAADYPAEPVYRLNVATTLFSLAGLLRETGRPAEAEGLLREGLRESEKLVEESPRVAAYRLNLAGGCHALGLLQHAAGRSGDAEKAFARCLRLYRELTESCPDRADLKLGHAWALVTCPVPALRDPARAVELARQAAAQSEGPSRLVLAVASYRRGDYRACAEALGHESPGPAWQTFGIHFFLAMARWRLGEREAARQAYDRGVRCREAARWRGDLARLLHAEAEELLGLRAGQGGVAAGK